MPAELRKSGIRIVGDLPWGTHFCQFYETKEDLLDILIPYFKTGLEDNEFCLWVVFEPLNEKQAKIALRRAVPEADQYLAAGNIEIIPHTVWYLSDGLFDPQRVLNGWNEKLTQALAGGYDGMRATGNEAWLVKKGGKDFSEYKKQLEDMMTKQRMIMLCAYSLTSSGTADILEVVRTHQFALAKRHGNWEIVAPAELKQAQTEIKRLNEELEQRVVERSRVLSATIEKLKREVSERHRVAEGQRENQPYEALVQSIDGIVWEAEANTFRFTFVSQQAERILGYPLERWFNELAFWADHLHPDDRAWAVHFRADATAKRKDHQFEYRMIAADGRIVWLRDIVTVTVLEDQSARLCGVMVDLTERKQAEEQASLLQTISMEVAAAKDLSTALRIVLRRVCEKTDWVYGQAWLPRRDGTVLDCGPAWFCGTDLENFRAICEDLTFPPGKGLPGRAWSSKQPVWLEDATLDANFPRAEFAIESGLKAALALPILTEGEVVAVIEFFLRERREEDERSVQVIAAVGAQLGLVIERKRVEDALRASEERFSKAFALSPCRMGIIRIKDGVVLDVNARWVQEMGVSREEVIGQSMFELKEWLRYEQEPRLTQLLKEGKPFRDVELQMSTRSGEKRVILSSAEVIELDGEPCFLAVANDITKRKQAEERLRREKNLTEQIINSLPGIFYIFDEQGRFLRWNENFERVTGYSSEEIVRISPLDLFTGEDQKKIQECLQKVFRKGTSATDVELVAKDETRTPYHFTGRRVPLDDKLCDFGMGIDATDRKLMEEQLKATGAQLRALMESFRSAKEEEGIRIARELHDELGSALTGLKVDLSWLGRRVLEAGDEAIRKKLKDMAELIDEIMQKVRNIATELRPSVLDDLGLVAAIKWLASEFQKRTEIKCKVTARQEEIALSPEKSTAIFRILQEILTNVARHAQATSVQISIKEQQKDLVLKVSDNGRGIKESDLSNSKSLGLLGMRERAGAFGGGVNVTGVEGKGTTVTVAIPRE